MDAPALVDVRLTYAYQTEHDGLQTVSMPVMLVPACMACRGFCDQQPCAACGANFCNMCSPGHACCCMWCGSRTSKCNGCGASFCERCAPEHDCGSSVAIGSESSAASDGEPEKEPIGKTGDSIWQPRLREPTYTLLLDLWRPRGMPTARLKEHMWVEVASAPELCRPLVDARGTRRFFGEDIGDFSLLSDALAWDFPKGAAVIHLDRQSTIVCMPGRSAHAANVNSALSWLRSLKDQTVGIVLRIIGGSLRGAFLEVAFEPHIDREATAKRRRAIVEAVERLTSLQP